MHSVPITLAICDDHQIVIDGIASLLAEDPALKILYTNTSAKCILQQLQASPPQILITDVMMPEMMGNELAKQVRQLLPEVRIIALSMSGQGRLVEGMIADADIAGYVLKNVGRDTLICAIKKVASGGQYFSEEVLDELAKQAHLHKETEAVHLTTREVEIIALIEKDLSNKQIADKLCISDRTVETHRKNIFRKTQTNNALALVKWAYEHQVIIATV